MSNLKTMSWEDIQHLSQENMITLWCSKLVEDELETYFQEGMRFTIQSIKIDEEDDGCIHIALDLSNHILFNAFLETNTWFDHKNKPRLDGHGQRFEKTLYLGKDKKPAEYFSKIEIEPLSVGNNLHSSNETSNLVM